MHFLAGQDASEAWLAENQGAQTLSLDDAVELGRLACRSSRTDAQNREAARPATASPARRGRDPDAGPIGPVGLIARLTGGLAFVGLALFWDDVGGRTRCSA